MATDERRTKEPDRSDVREFIPCSAGTKPREEHTSSSLARSQKVVDNDDDPGPSAA
jgi:hypothetical protein